VTSDQESEYLGVFRIRLRTLICVAPLVKRNTIVFYIHWLGLKAVPNKKVSNVAASRWTTVKGTSDYRQVDSPSYESFIFWKSLSWQQ